MTMTQTRSRTWPRSRRRQQLAWTQRRLPRGGGADRRRSPSGSCEAADLPAGAGVLDVAAGSGNAALAAARAGCGSPASTTCPSCSSGAGCGPRRRAFRRLRRGRRRATAVRGRLLRRGPLRPRGDVRPGPGASGGRAAPGRPAGRHPSPSPDWTPDGLHRRPPPDGRPARPAAGRAAAAGATGEPRTGWPELLGGAVGAGLGSPRGPSCFRFAAPRTGSSTSSGSTTGRVQVFERPWRGRPAQHSHADLTALARRHDSSTNATLRIRAAYLETLATR